MKEIIWKKSNQSFDIKILATLLIVTYMLCYIFNFISDMNNIYDEGFTYYLTLMMLLFIIGALFVYIIMKKFYFKIDKDKIVYRNIFIKEKVYYNNDIKYIVVDTNGIVLQFNNGNTKYIINEVTEELIEFLDKNYNSKFISNEKYNENINNYKNVYKCSSKIKKYRKLILCFYVFFFIVTYGYLFLYNEHFDKYYNTIVEEAIRQNREFGTNCFSSIEDSKLNINIDKKIKYKVIINDEHKLESIKIGNSFKYIVITPKRWNTSNKTGFTSYNCD